MSIYWLVLSKLGKKKEENKKGANGFAGPSFKQSVVCWSEVDRCINQICAGNIKTAMIHLATEALKKTLNITRIVLKINCC